MVPRRCVLTVGVAILVIHYAESSRPKISIPWRRKTRYLAPSTEVQLQCVAQAHPKLRYSWLREDQEINSTFGFDVNSVNGTLKISNFTSNKEGRYKCRAQNTDGLTVSPAITLREAKLSLTWNVPVFEKSISAGDPLSLECRNPPISIPTGIISWHKGGRGLQLTDRMRIDEEGSLHFAYTEREDQDEYSCGIYNPVLSVTKLGSNVKVKIMQGQGITDMPPHVVSPRRNRVAYLGRGLKLECIFSGRPIPKVTWSHNGSPMPEKLNGPVLSIRTVTVTDAGTYKCSGDNSAGTDDVDIDVTVKSGPMWVEAPKRQIVMEGEDANFSCKAESVGSDSPLEVTWLHEWTPIKDSRLSVSEDNSTLTIHSVVMGDNDCVQCEVSNDIDYITKEACLWVVNDTDDLPQTNITEETKPVEKGTVQAGPTNGGLIAGLIVAVLIAVAAVIVVVVIWKKRQKKNRQYLTVLRNKDPNDNFAEKAKRRQTV